MCTRLRRAPRASLCNYCDTVGCGNARLKAYECGISSSKLHRDVGARPRLSAAWHGQHRVSHHVSRRPPTGLVGISLSTQLYSKEKEETFEDPSLRRSRFRLLADPTALDLVEAFVKKLNELNAVNEFSLGGEGAQQRVHVCLTPAPPRPAPPRPAPPRGLQMYRAQILVQAQLGWKACLTRVPGGDRRRRPGGGDGHLLLRHQAHASMEGEREWDDLVAGR
jgi:hypothetical protein